MDSKILRDSFLSRIVKRLPSGITEDEKVFRLTMEIHNTHEKLKNNIIDEESLTLLNYHKSIIESDNSFTSKDLFFFNVYEVPQVYSFYLDKTFPLMEYPYHLYNKEVKTTKPEYADLKKFYDNLKYDRSNPKFEYLNLFLS